MAKRPAPASRRRMDFESIIQDGEGAGPGGFVVQTANGTGRWKGTGHNLDHMYSWPEVEPDATRPAGRSNRTAE